MFPGLPLHDSHANLWSELPESGGGLWHEYTVECACLSSTLSFFHGRHKEIFLKRNKRKKETEAGREEETETASPPLLLPIPSCAFTELLSWGWGGKFSFLFWIFLSYCFAPITLHIVMLFPKLHFNSSKTIFPEDTLYWVLLCVRDSVMKWRERPSALW